MADEKTNETAERKLLETATSMGLYNARKVLDLQIAEVEKVLGVGAVPGTPSGVASAQIITPAAVMPMPIAPVAPRKKARKLTVEARKKIADAQKRRWAKQKGSPARA